MRLLYGEAEGVTSPDDATLWVLGSGESGVSSALAVRPQAWESALLGRRAVRLGPVAASGTYDEQGERLGRLLEFWTRQADDADDVGVATARLDERDAGTLHALEAAGFRFIECLLTFCSTRTVTAPDTPAAIEVAGPDAAAELGALAGRSFRYSRLHSDPRVALGVADRSRAEWIENACRGNADIVFGAWVEGRAVGFVSCTRVRRDDVDRGCIDLIAVDPELPRRGVGTALVATVLDHYARQERLVLVGTQAKNVPSVNLYLKCGFRLVSSQVTLTRHREAT